VIKLKTAKVAQDTKDCLKPPRTQRG